MDHNPTSWTVTIIIVLAGWIIILPCEPLQSLLYWLDGSRSYLVNSCNASGLGHDFLWTVTIKIGWDIVLVSAVPPVFVRTPWCSTVTEAVLVWLQRVIDVMKMDIETYEWNVTRNMLDSGALKWVSFFLSPPPLLFLARPAPAVWFEPRRQPLSSPLLKIHSHPVLFLLKPGVYQNTALHIWTPLSLIPDRTSTFSILLCNYGISLFLTHLLTWIMGWNAWRRSECENEWT